MTTTCARVVRVMATLDEAGGVIRLSPARSKTLVGRILPYLTTDCRGPGATAGAPRPRQPAGLGDLREDAHPIGEGGLCRPPCEGAVRIAVHHGHGNAGVGHFRAEQDRRRGFARATFRRDDNNGGHSYVIGFNN